MGAQQLDDPICPVPANKTYEQSEQTVTEVVHA